ncbi:odorant receptor 94b-like [Bradysia coprophila]|uniref:odorant receptor 94b-like n=1 Tax=Bradysia coprophila TaxID=38358 RepID=UPI00187D93A5|nr:odorant receptor 94b-like [Bradysia coprophila]
MHLIQIHKIISLIISFFYLIARHHRGDKPTVKEFRIKLLYSFYYPLFVLSLVVGAITNDKEDQNIFLSEVAIGSSVLLIKLWFLIWKQNQILDLLNRVCVFSIQNDDAYNLFNNKLRGFLKLVFVFAITVAVAGSSGTIVMSFVGNGKTLFLEVGFPMDWRNNEIAFWMASIFVFTEVLLSLLVMIFTIMIWYLLLICSLRYEVLGTQLRSMGKNREKDKMTENKTLNNFFVNLKDSVKVHLHLRGLTNDVGFFFSDIFFIQFGTSGLCICGSIYCLAFGVGESLVERFVHVLVFFYLTADIFMITYVGNEIMLSSNRLSYSLFESEWYNQPQFTKKCIIIFGEYLKQPQAIVIGKLYPLTLETFTRIINSACSMFNILKNIK